MSSLWRFPVKSMQGERIGRAELTTSGVVGDRAYGLIDMATGKVVSAKSTKLFPDVIRCRATFIDEPGPETDPPPVRIALADGTIVRSDADDIDAVLSRYFGRAVSLATAAPENFTIDHYLPERDAVVEGKLGSALWAQTGLPSAVPIGSFFDGFPVSVLTTSTLARLSELQPASRFDERRFRMNVIVDSKEAGFVENGWLDRELAIGDVVRLSVDAPDLRCVMTNLAQDELPHDNEILRTLARHNRIGAGRGAQPCAGVYATVRVGGSLQSGDVVTIQ